MAKVNFNEIDFTNNGSTFNGPSVGFFGLSNDGDEALVRFIQDSTDDFEIVSTHQINVNNKYRRISCLRADGNEPLDNCPFCASGAQIQNRFYIKLIQYVKDENGGIVPQAKVWERSLQYAKTLKSYIDNYGPLSDIMCKIIRHGAAGSMQTTYEIVPNLNANIYREDIYPKSKELFDGYNVVGAAVMNKSFEDIEVFLSTGNFSHKQEQSEQGDVPFTMSNAQQPQMPANTPNNYQQSPVMQNANPAQFNQQPVQNQQRTAPWQQGQNTNNVSKPVRYY